MDKPDLPERTSGLTPMSATGLLKLVETTDDAVVVTGADQRIRFFNKGAEAMFGWKSHEVIGQPLSILLPRKYRSVHNDKVRGFSDEKSESRAMSQRNPVWGLNRNGKEFPAAATITKYEHDGELFFAALVRDISIDKQREAALEDALRRADEANEFRTRFFAQLSHEFRTPLNAIIGYSQMIRDQVRGPVGAEDYKNYARDIHDSGTHLLELVNDVVDLSRIEAGKLELDEAVVDLSKLIGTVMRILNQRFDDAGINLQLDVRADLSAVIVDERRMRQILFNLLGNAVKYTDAGGQVGISARLDDSGEIRIAVSDTGIGMSDDQVQMALEPFQQVRSEANRRNNGSGLGLSISKSLIALHDGRLEINSEPGVGTTMAVILPASRLAQTTQAYAHDHA